MSNVLKPIRFTRWLELLHQLAAVTRGWPTMVNVTPSISNSNPNTKNYLTILKTYMFSPT